jgi:hypothetical protein
MIEQLTLDDTFFPPMRELPKFVYPPERYPLREKISISFSGGATSGMMLKLLLDHFRKYEPQREIVVTFCNTGLEHEKTLEFVQKCDMAFDANVVWLESVVNHGERVGVGHRIVNFETASRNGEPFEQSIRKYGIPCKTYPNCNGRLKTEVMHDYHRSIGWSRKSYSSAVGIRADEIDRISLTAMQQGVFYPCADAGIMKSDVRSWWAVQSFKLEIPEHYGNCVTCWKKSDRKLLTIARENPSAFDFMDRMEKKYALAGGARRDGTEKFERSFFRKNRTAQDILELSKKPFDTFIDGKFIPFDDELDIGSGCGESCEIGAD